MPSRSLAGGAGGSQPQTLQPARPTHPHRFRAARARAGAAPAPRPGPRLRGRKALPAGPVPRRPPRRGSGTGTAGKRHGGSAASIADSPGGRPQSTGRTSATRARRTLTSRPAVPPLVPACPELGPAGFLAPRPSRRYPSSLPHSPGPVALPTPLLSLLVPVAGGGGGAAPGSCAGCGATEPSLAPSSPALPRPRPAPSASPGPDVTQAPPSALRRREARAGRGGRLRGSPRARAQQRRWQPPSAEGAGGRRKDKSRRRRPSGGLGSQRKTEVSEDGRGLTAPAQGAPCSARLGRGAQVTVAEVSRAGPVAVLAPGVKRDRQPVGRGLGFLF